MYIPAHHSLSPPIKLPEVFYTWQHQDAEETWSASVYGENHKEDIRTGSTKEGGTDSGSAGKSQRELAEEYGIGLGTVCRTMAKKRSLLMEYGRNTNGRL